MSGAHRIEVSPNNRAGCKNTECKKSGIKIQKGQIRYGTFIAGPDFQSWAWKHWGCVTPKQISNLKASVEGDPSQLDGYDELPEEYQEKVVNALEQGHIDDEDWGWDIEMNRDGKNGYRTLESKRRLKAEAQALKEETAGEGSASPSKTDNKKRGYVKDDPDAEGAAVDEPPAKKTKARMKKEQNIKNEDANGGSENEGPTIKKTKSRIKKEPKIKNEDADGGYEHEGSIIPKPKSRVKKEPKIKNEDADGGSEDESSIIPKTKSKVKKEPSIKNEDADGEFENGVLANKKGKAAVKKGKKVNGDEANGDIEQDAQPVKKGRKRARKATAEDEFALNIKDESSDHDAVPPPKEKKTRAPRKAAAAKKIKDEDTETDSPDPASELETPLGNVKLEHPSEIDPELSEDAPEVQKGHKKASKKAVAGKAEKVKKESKSKTNTTAPRSNGRVTRSRPV